MKALENCTLLLSTYDGGEDLWEGFFTALVSGWENFDMPIVMNTESKSYKFKDLNIKCFNFYKAGQKIPWAKRLIRTLKAIKTDYILFFLEDFWLEDKVDVDFFEKSIEWMNENPDVAVLSFKPVSAYGPNIRDNRFERFERRPQKGKYRFNCQVAVWRRTRLIKFLRSHESPWEWEIMGSRRSSRFKDGFYSLIEGEKEVFPYNHDMGGVIHRGRWCKGVVLPLCEKHNLNIDFNKRGFNEDIVFVKKEPQKEKFTFKVFLRKIRTVFKIINNKIRVLRSII